MQLYCQVLICQEVKECAEQPTIVSGKFSESNHSFAAQTLTFLLKALLEGLYYLVRKVREARKMRARSLYINRSTNVVHDAAEYQEHQNIGHSLDGRRLAIPHRLDNKLGDNVHERFIGAQCGHVGKAHAVWVLSCFCRRRAIRFFSREHARAVLRIAAVLHHG